MINGDERLLVHRLALGVNAYQLPETALDGRSEPFGVGRGERKLLDDGDDQLLADLVDRLGVQPEGVDG